MEFWTIYKILMFTAASIKMFILLPGNENLEGPILIVKLFLSMYFLPIAMALAVAVINNRGFIFNLHLVARGMAHLLIGLEIDYLLLLAGVFTLDEIAYCSLGHFVCLLIINEIMQIEPEPRVPELQNVAAE